MSNNLIVENQDYQSTNTPEFVEVNTSPVDAEGVVDDVISIQSDDYDDVISELTSEGDSFDDSVQELLQTLRKTLRQCSRQRLRAVHMSLRYYATADSRVSVKDLQQVLQDNEIELDNETLMTLSERFEDTRGVDYKRLWDLLSNTQHRTGRDSALARRKGAERRKSLTSSADVIRGARSLVNNREKPETENKKSDQERFLYRLQARLTWRVNEGDPVYDLSDLRKQCKELDELKTGRINKDEMIRLWNKNRLPVYGVLLNQFLYRFSQSKNPDLIRWKDALDFIEKLQNGPAVQPPSIQNYTPVIQSNNFSQNSETNVSDLQKNRPTTLVSSKKSDQDAEAKTIFRPEIIHAGGPGVTFRKSKKNGFFSGIAPIIGPRGEILEQVAVQEEPRWRRERKKWEDMSNVKPTERKVIKSSSDNKHQKKITSTRGGEEKQASNRDLNQVMSHGKEVCHECNRNETSLKNDSQEEETSKPTMTSTINDSEINPATSEPSLSDLVLSNQNLSSDNLESVEKENGAEFSETSSISSKSQQSKQSSASLQSHPVKQREDASDVHKNISELDDKQSVSSIKIDERQCISSIEKIEDNRKNKIASARRYSPIENKSDKSQRKISAKSHTLTKNNEKINLSNENKNVNNQTTKLNHSSSMESLQPAGLEKEVWRDIGDVPKKRIISARSSSGSTKRIHNTRYQRPNSSALAQNKNRSYPLLFTRAKHSSNSLPTNDALTHGSLPALGDRMSSGWCMVKFSVDLLAGRKQVAIPVRMEEKLATGSVETPKLNLELEWIYGCQQQRSLGKTVTVLVSSDEVVYSVGRVIVLQKINGSEQRFYLEHSSNINCISSLPDSTLIASGQESGRGKDSLGPTVRLWKSDSLVTLRVFQCFSLARSRRISFILTAEDEIQSKMQRTSDSRNADVCTISSISISGEQEQICATTSSGHSANNLHVWNLNTGNELLNKVLESKDKIQAEFLMKKPESSEYLINTYSGSCTSTWILTSSDQYDVIENQQKTGNKSINGRRTKNIHAIVDMKEIDDNDDVSAKFSDTEKKETDYKNRNYSKINIPRFTVNENDSNIEYNVNNKEQVSDVWTNKKIKDLILHSTVDISSRRKDRLITSTHVLSDDGHVCLGASDGRISFRAPINKGGRLLGFIRGAHEGKVTSFLFFPPSSLLSAGSDSFIHCWRLDKDLLPCSRRPTNSLQLPVMHRGDNIVSLMLLKDLTIIVVTSGGSILRLNQNKLQNSSNPLKMSHFSPIVSDLCRQADRDRKIFLCQVTSEQLLSVSRRGLVSLHNICSRKTLWSTNLEGDDDIVGADIDNACHLLCTISTSRVNLFRIKPLVKGKGLHVSGQYGDIRDVQVSNIFTSTLHGSDKTTESYLTTVKLSPDARSLAIGDRSGHMFILGAVIGHQQKLRWNIITEWQAHDSVEGGIEGIDWSQPTSSNNRCIRTMTSDKTLKFWTTSTGMLIKDSGLISRLRWASDYCALSYDLAGIYSSEAVVKNGGIRRLAVDSERRVAAVLDVRGGMHLYQLPCPPNTETNTPSRSYTPEVDQIKDLCFCQDSTLIAVAGSILLQWKLV